MRRALLSLLLIAGARPLAAQTICSTPNGSANTSCSGNVASSLTIPIILRLTLDDTSSTITSPTSADYTAGQTSSASTGPVATIRSNNNWTLLVRASAAVWTGTGGARATKPAGDLLWSKTSGGSYTALTTTNVTVATGTRGSSNVTTLFYKTNWAWNLDTPGTYTLTVIYTATAP